MPDRHAPGGGIEGRPYSARLVVLLTGSHQLMAPKGAGQEIQMTRAVAARVVTTLGTIIALATIVGAGRKWW